MKKYIWHRMWARKYAPFLSSTFMRVFQKNPGLNCSKNKLFVPEGNLHAIYFEKRELDKIVRFYHKFLNKQNLKIYSKWYENEFSKFLIWSKKINKRDFQKFSNPELAKLLAILDEKMVYFTELQFYAFLVLEGPAKTLEKKLKNNPKALEAICTPYKFTQIAKARVELLKLAAKNNKNKLQTYAKKYSWLSIYDFIDKPLKLKDFKKQIKNIKHPKSELKTIFYQQKQGLATYKKFLTTLKPIDKKLVEIVHHFSYLKEMRDDYRRHSYFLWQKFWQEIAKRTSLSFEDTNYLLAKELIELLLKNNKNTKLIALRKQKYAHWYKEGKLFTFEANRVKKIEKMVNIESFQNSVKGFAAFNGKIRGRANIIYHQEEFYKFKQGDILITTMTHPEFMPIMRQAKAIVTDEGGITCHAAIIAREMKKPCIIGTKIATKIFKDGDIIEVNANQGIVLKLQ